MSTATPAIQTEKLTKYYDGARGIVDLDLRVETGEIFGFLGPNGAGKTTAIRIVMDLIRPTSGRASIDGLDCQQESVKIKTFTRLPAGRVVALEQPDGATEPGLPGELAGRRAYGQHRRVRRAIGARPGP